MPNLQLLSWHWQESKRLLGSAEYIMKMSMDLDIIAHPHTTCIERETPCLCVVVRPCLSLPPLCLSHKDVVSQEEVLGGEEQTVCSNPYSSRCIWAGDTQSVVVIVFCFCCCCCVLTHFLVLLLLFTAVRGWVCRRRALQRRETMGTTSIPRGLWVSVCVMHESTHLHFLVGLSSWKHLGWYQNCTPSNAA